MMEAQGGRKLLVTMLGAVAGLCLALMLQQAGVLPLDRVSAFGLPAVLAAAAFIMIVVRSRFARTVTEWIAIIVVLVLVVMAATGIPALASDGERGGPTGYLDGDARCTVSATSPLASFDDPSETSRSGPFDIDPDGEVGWVAMSGVAITDHKWEIWVDVGGFPLTIASDGDDNSGLSRDSVGERLVRPYVDDVASYIGGEPVGIYLVGGEIIGNEGRGPGCDGQAWVRLPGGVFSNAVGQGATGLLVLVTVLVIVLVVKVQRTVVEEVVTRTVTSDGPPPGPGGSDNPLDDIGGGSGSVP